ncbi:hypothetical protein MKEN_01472200 [Mycena kentingensis (nom. inval.)]|nr:hypothetical protein MKEN_01472200 [Mycena kentingensis (nom. inval.)]
MVIPVLNRTSHFRSGSANEQDCLCCWSIPLCDFFCTFKVLIYLFLTEQVYIVWGKGVKRMRSPVYLVCLISADMYAAVMLAMFFGRIHHFRDGDEACILGLKPTASLPLLSYDLYINVLLTTLFIWPILRSKHSTMQMRGVATRTLIAAGVALTTSTVNIAVLTILHGNELGWVCLGSCSTNVIFDAATLFYCTAGRGGARTGPSGTPSAGRQVSGSESANGITLAPGTPSRPNHNINFKSASDMYPMADIASPGRREFKIHVTATTEEQSDIDKGDIAGEHGRTSPK